MVVSGYLYHRRCPEPWTKEVVQIQVGSKPTPAASLFLSGTKDRARLLSIFSSGNPAIDVHNSSYCELLQAVHSSVGLRAEAMRSFVAVDGVRRMIIDRVRLQQYASVRAIAREEDSGGGGGRGGGGGGGSAAAQSLPFGRKMVAPTSRFRKVVEFCVSDVTPPDTPRAARTWASLTQQLALPANLFRNRNMGRRYEGHRSRGSDCEKRALGLSAQKALFEHKRWLANLHGYSSYEHALKSHPKQNETAVLERLLGGPCIDETADIAPCDT